MHTIPYHRYIYIYMDRHTIHTGSYAHMLISVMLICSSHICHVLYVIPHIRLSSHLKPLCIPYHTIHPYEIMLLRSYKHKQQHITHKSTNARTRKHTNTQAHKHANRLIHYHEHTISQKNSQTHRHKTKKA